MASQLSIYNESCRLCGERRLSAVDETRKIRYLLDDVWTDGRKRCLELGQWRFAIRSSELPYDSDFTPPFGYQYAFSKPEDLVRVVGVCSDEYFKIPVVNVMDEGEFWFSDLQTLYVRYVSNDAEFGYNLGVWPETFAMFVAAHFASEIVFDLTGDEKKQAIVMRIRDERLQDAKTNDAMKDPVKFAPAGSWVASRGSGFNRDPSGGQLIG